MTIPRIAPYPMPEDTELPPSRLPWSLDARRSVLLVHDAQRYFLDFFDVEASPVSDMLRNIETLQRACRERGVPVVYTAQPGEQTPSERGLLRDLWGPGITAEPAKSAIAPTIAPQDGDVVLRKWRYSAFRRTELLEVLRAYGRDQIVVSGVYAHIGCLLTACDAFMHDLQPFFVADAVADFSQEEHRMAMTYAARLCAVPTTTKKVLAAFGATAGSTSKARALTLEGMRSDVAELLRLAPVEVRDDDDWLTLGLDSVRLMSLLERWRRAGASLSFVDLAERPTLAAVSALLARGNAELRHA